ncbi:hypothetical protein [Psychroserpens mesophilus]|uniref:hypothetical protein n=1 Tax=Psychroserpens mesophilus TaxID=325473 RepID=UPI00059040EE|nr:hypothetical protein [Psychroserpens mesophilus]
MRNYLLVFFLVASVFACKEEKQVEIKSTQEKQLVKSKEALSFMLEAIIENSGTFTLFYLEEGQEQITLKNSKSTEVKGSAEPQVISFTIRDEIIPDKLFLRFVNDEKQQTITVKTTSLFYGKKSIVIQDSLFYQYFMPNKFVDYDVNNFKATTKEIDGEYLPRFSSRDVLLQKMLLEF